MKLTGRQGVLIPAANEPHLVLRRDVVQAIREEQFHVWTIEHIDQALELLSGVEPGTVDKEETFHGKVDQKLATLARRLKEQGAMAERAQVPAAGEARLHDPRPPLPGRE